MLREPSLIAAAPSLSAAVGDKRARALAKVVWRARAAPSTSLPPEELRATSHCAPTRHGAARRHPAAPPAAAGVAMPPPIHHIAWMCVCARACACACAPCAAVRGGLARARAISSRRCRHRRAVVDQRRLRGTDARARVRAKRCSAAIDLEARARARRVTSVTSRARACARLHCATRPLNRAARRCRPQFSVLSMCVWRACGARGAHLHRRRVAALVRHAKGVATLATHDGARCAPMSIDAAARCYICDCVLCESMLYARARPCRQLSLYNMFRAIAVRHSRQPPSATWRCLAP